MNRTARIRQLIKLLGAEDTKYIIDIAGPNCSFNVGVGVVEYTIRTQLFGNDGMTLEQRKQLAAIANLWVNVNRAYITKSDQQHVRIAFDSTAEEARSRDQFGRVFAL